MTNRKASEILTNYWRFTLATQCGKSKYFRAKRHTKMTALEAQTALRDDLLKLVGEDEEVPMESVLMSYIRGQNHLRAELRKSIREYFGEEL